ncbi:MAG: 30S ribosomal protein S3 [Clostridia bacterium]|nr:30S ribosomal protein S3 [Clostridia bacterium]
MGQKVNPHGLRVGVIHDWSTKWYADKNDFSKYLVEDYKIRKFLKTKLYSASVSGIEIERTANKVNIIVKTAKPGIIIGKNGAGIAEIKNAVVKLINRPAEQVNLSVSEIKSPDLDAQLCAENIAQQLEKRTSFRRAMKQVMGRAMRFGAKGIKATCGGRLGGAEIARSESYHEGTIPLQTLRADIDYGFAEANTTAGKIGVKVWIYKGEVLPGATKRTKNEGGKR